MPVAALADNRLGLWQKMLHGGLLSQSRETPVRRLE